MNEKEIKDIISYNKKATELFMPNEIFEDLVACKNFKGDTSRFKGKFEGDGYYEDAEAQLDKYAEVTDFKRGGNISTIDGIKIIDYEPYNPDYSWLHANDLYMRIESLDSGRIAYSFYIINDDEEDLGSEIFCGRVLLH